MQPMNNTYLCDVKGCEKIAQYQIHDKRECRKYCNAHFNRHNHDSALVGHSVNCEHRHHNPMNPTKLVM